MPNQSIRDQMVRGVPRHRRRKRWPWVLLAVVVVIGLLWLIFSLSSQDDDAAPETEPGNGQETAPTPPAEPTEDPAGPLDPAEPSESSGAAEPDDGDSSEPAPDAGAPTENERIAQEVMDQLGSLSESDGEPSSAYDRDLFGEPWYDLDGNGCSTRNDMLARDLEDVEYGTDGCRVASGTLDDWYSGETVDFVAGPDTSRLVHIDHIVALSWAWQHGADEWDEDKRLEFANDPLNLVATTDEMNLSKSDFGPDRWLPADETAHCEYVQNVTAILVEYELGINVEDRATMQGILEECAISDDLGTFAADLRG